eukprot:TRINITY_DN110058_c0_g1_i1.p1 TRINITY_DN110058_c0_g1~~TRINITY_DN110058_c0_g1_i1.p1  ORF type:complete len:343 (-),score=49.80 TRINITY_DN110058_c0_g1_i1:184-1212(-)
MAFRSAGGASASGSGGMSAPRTAGSMALSQSRGAHPTMRLDGFLRHTDNGYQHAEAPVQGDKFIRKMATYGQVRPSVSFVNEARVARPFKDHCAVDMSNLPAPHMDPTGDPRECTFEIPPPPENVNMDFVKMYQNHSLMLPSERYAEHLKMKAGEQQWRKDREDIFRYKKRMNVLEKKHPEGIMGVDGPTYPETILYGDRQGQLQAQAERRAIHAEGRFHHLHKQSHADDAVAMRNFGSDPGLPRSKDICIQRKSVDPEKHPFRFLDTHDRLFPQFTPVWDPERAAAQRSHDVRDKRHNIINGADNSLTYNVAISWEEAQKKRVEELRQTQGRTSSTGLTFE